MIKKVIMDDLVVKAPLDSLKPWNPLNGHPVWRGCEEPISPKEVEKAIKNKLFFDEPIVSSSPRKDHIARIAFLVVNGWWDYIELDFGVPSMGYCPKWPVVDGNHRLAAAFFDGHTTIDAGISGSLEEAEKILGIKIKGRFDMKFQGGL